MRRDEPQRHGGHGGIRTLFPTDTSGPNMSASCPGCGCKFAFRRQPENVKSGLRCPDCHVGLHLPDRAAWGCLYLVVYHIPILAWYIFLSNTLRYGFVIACGTGLLLLIVAIRVHARKQRWITTTNGVMCGDCGYDMFGCAGSHCPECGSAEESPQIETQI